MKHKPFAAVLALILAVLLLLTGCGSAESAYYDDNAIADFFYNRIATRYAQNYLVQQKGIIIHAQADYFSGVSKVCDIQLTRETLIELELEASGGKFKIVLIKEGRVTVLFENDGRLLVDLGTLEAGEYELKFVGHRVKFELDMTVTQCS